MACMCGDTCCPSCGPAQGNNRCFICGAWDSDGGCEDPEKCAAAQAEWDARESDALARELKEEEELARQFNQQQGGAR